MTTDAPSEYERFRKTFFEECTEILSDLEGRLGQLQAGPAAQEDLNAIFRAVHSIKAGAGAFNYRELVEFSHIFEAMLDRLRDGKIEPDERVTHTLLRAGDILSALVAAAQQGESVEEGFGGDVAEELQALLDGSGRPAQERSAPEESSPSPHGKQLYRIGFQPHAELFRHANEPLLLVRELKQLGDLTVVCDQFRLPSLALLEPEEAYLSWTFELLSHRSRNEILDVFEFVDQDCDLSVEVLAAVEEEQSAASEPADTPLAQPSAPDSAGDSGRPPPGSSQRAKPARSVVSSIRVDISRIDRLVNMAGELVIAQAMLAQQIDDQLKEDGKTIHGHEDLAALTRELQECVMAIRMQPVKSVFARMPRLVREVVGKLGKSVRLVTSGEQTEVDKTVIEELADPLTHILRNAIDHGIESQATRRERGKPEEGLIQLSASHVGSNILIQIADDGAGINREKLLAKATSRGIVALGATLSDDEIDDLIFAPGLSTAETITDLSGRGVGMDVVRRNITNLGGRIQVHSTPGRGTRFTLVIPLTLAVLDGMGVAVGAQRYILPLTSIVESFRPQPRQIRSLTDGRQIASIRGDFFRLLHLDRVFNIPDAIVEPWRGLVVLVETAGGEKVGIKVDELIGQQQVVIKNLQENFHPIPGISGATILGDGSVALILDIEELTKLNERLPETMTPLIEPHEAAPDAFPPPRRSPRNPNPHALIA